MFPSLPTDNLYKFVFVGCIFLIGFIVYYRTSKEEIIYKEHNNLTLEYIKNESRSKLLDKDNERFGKDLEFWENKKKISNYPKDSMRNVLDKHYLRTLNLRDTTLILIENLKFGLNLRLSYFL